MAPWRSFDRELDVGLLVLLAVLLAVALVGGVLTRRRERAEQGQHGGRGYTPADLRPLAPTTPRTRPAPEDAWLLGLAAPFVEAAGLMHDRWELTPEPRDVAWERQLDRWLAQNDVVTRESWVRIVRELEWAITHERPEPDEVDHRPWLVARHAYLCRLGSAAGHVGTEESRTRVHSAASILRADVTDWFGFADAFLASATGTDPTSVPAWRATVRRLYAPGGPWADVAWPPPPSSGDGAGRS